MPRDDLPNTTARRTQKVYADILGRTYKTEVMNWDGATPFTTTVQTFNGRDQVINTRQYAGGQGSSTFQDVSVGYDGHGRVKTRHYPIEDAYTNTTWNYNADDSIHMVIDPHGVISNFAYYQTNGLVQTISYNSNDPNIIPNTPNVSFSYDNLGNRTQMTDGTGTATYAYNQLSQIVAETKTISGVAGNFTINYGYNLSGGLQSLSDPQNATQQVNYSFDKIGRATSAQMVSAGTTIYSVFGTKYRAWGGIKEYQYGQQGGSNPNYLKYQYDARLNVSEYEMGTQSLGMLERVNYQRYADGKLKFAVNSPDHKFDRSFKYTGIGTLQEGLSGRAANNDPNLNITDTPFRQNLIYNAFGEIDTIYGQYWGRAVPYYSTGLYPVSRDEAGNIVAERVQNNPTIQNRSYQWDAAGRQVQVTDPPLRSWESQMTDNTSYDGNGGRVKSEKIIGGQITSADYELKSTVLGGETVGIRQQNENGTIGTGFSAPAADRKLGQADNLLGNFGVFEWTAPDGIKTSNAELDPRGAEVEEVNPYDNGGEAGGTYPARDDATNYARCAYDNLPISCSLKEKFDEYDRRRNSIITRIVRSGQRNAPTLKQGGRLSKEEVARRKRAFVPTSKNNEADDDAGEERGSLDNRIPDFVGAEFSNSLQTAPKLRGGTSEEQKLFKESFDKAKELIKEKKCADALGKNAAKLLSTAKYSVSPSLTKGIEDPSEEYKELKYLSISNLGKGITFDRKHSFLSGKSSYSFFGNNYQLDNSVKPKTSAELGAYTILEGIGGLAGGVHGAGAAERGNETRVDNAKTILDNCFGVFAPPPPEDDN